MIILMQGTLTLKCNGHRNSFLYKDPTYIAKILYKHIYVKTLFGKYLDLVSLLHLFSIHDRTVLLHILFKALFIYLT